MKNVQRRVASFAELADAFFIGLNTDAATAPRACA